MKIPLLFPLLGVVAVTWFWIRAARPMLQMVGNRWTERAGLGITVATVIAGGVAVLLDGSELYQIGWLAWGVLFSIWFVVLVMLYPRYRPLLRLTGGGDPRNRLLDVLYHLGGALGYLAMLDALETPETAEIAALWRAEAVAVQAGGPDPTVSERHEAIRTEAHRLWPDGEKWQGAAILMPEAAPRSWVPPRR